SAIRGDGVLVREILSPGHSDCTDRGVRDRLGFINCALAVCCRYALNSSEFVSETMSEIPRKAARQPSSAQAFLYSADGWPLGECRMRDVSSSGAKLVHEIQDEMPKRFLLSFSRDGRVRRQCQVVWRKEREIGVRFVKD